MKQEIKNKFPKWIKEDTKYNLMLSDDIDSLFSCVILNFLKGYKINSFYNFNSIYIAEGTETETETKHTIGVDADLIHNKCWGNHVQLNNKDSANLNTVLGIGQTNYTQKFCGSTLLQILSYYNVDVSRATELQKMILLTIDSTFLGFWFNNGYYCKKYLKMLDLECLLDILEKHTKQEFIDLDKKYNINGGKIWVNKDNTLDTDIYIEEIEKLFPKLDFCFLVRDLKLKKTKNFKIVQSSYLQHDKEKIFSCARTYRNALRYSIY